VIGVSKEIEDEAALVFSEVFYDAIGAGDDVELAFEVAVNAIEMEGMAEEGKVSVLLVGA